MNPALRATRARAPRVRTGCITCKYVLVKEHSIQQMLMSNIRRRHIKCDERKPFCRKCAAACQVCEGYEVAPTRKPRALGTRYRQREPLPPFTGYCQRQDQLSLSQPSILNPEPSEDDVCRDLFYHARTVTLEDLETALSPTDFWYNYALPLGHSTDAVRHAICALGGAHRVFKMKYGHPGNALQMVQQVSLQQYNLAIRSVKDLMGRATQEDLEIVLTCCVVFISLENLYGHYAESLRHIKAGSSLLASSLNRDAKQGTFPSIKVRDDFAQTLCRLGDDIWGYIREMVAPDLNFFSAAENEERHGGHFNTIGEAEQELHNITKLFEADTSVIQRKVLAYARYGHSENQRHFMPQKLPETHPDTSFEVLIARFQRWSKAFDIFQKEMGEAPSTSQDALRTKALAVDQALWRGWLRCNEWRDYRQEDLDAIIQRAESLVEHDTFKISPVFAFDGSLILCVAMACVTTTDTDTQWRAIRLLRSFWRREGIWDSQELADILEAMVIATSKGMITKDQLPWDVPHLARMMDSLSLSEVQIPGGPLSLVDHIGTRT